MCNSHTNAAESAAITTVLAGPDDVVTCRMPTGAERQALGIDAPGVPVLSLTRPGRAEELFDSRASVVLATAEPGPASA
jgi:hypothetical protein